MDMEWSSMITKNLINNQPLAEPAGGTGLKTLREESLFNLQ